MKQLLIVGNQILAAGYFFDDADELRVYRDAEMTECDAIYPHHVMEGYGIAEVELPDDFTCAGYEWAGELVKKTPVVAPKTRDELKLERTEAVAAIIVTTSSGKTFDGDEDSQTRMARAVLIAQATGLTETTWTLADNTIATVTLPELTEALALAGQRQAELWPIPS